MLAAGTELALDRFTASDDVELLPHIRVAEVASRATAIVRRLDPDAPAITTGSIYPIWPDQAAFQGDLMVHLLADDHLGVAPEWNELVAYLEQTSDDVHAVVATFARIGWRHARDHRRLWVVLSEAPAVASSPLQAELSAHYDRLWDQLVPAYQLICSRFRYRPRGGRSFRDFARAAAALVDGFVVQHLADGDQLDERDDHFAGLHGESWTLLGDATVALFDRWFEPETD